MDSSDDLPKLLMNYTARMIDVQNNRRLADQQYDLMLAALREREAVIVKTVLDKAEDMLLDRSFALMNEDTAVKWDDVVAVIASLKSGESR